MKLFLLIIPFVNGLLKNPNLILRNNSLKSNQSPFNNIIEQKSFKIKKIKSISKLIRCVNILPTLFLSFSGGFIVNPSLYNLFSSTEFISSTFITVSIV